MRNLENVIAWNEMMINQKRPKEAIEKYTRPDYIQHNPLLEDGPQGIMNYFTQVTTERKNARLVYHRTIAAGDYVYTPVCSTTSSTTIPTTTGWQLSTSSGWTMKARRLSIGTYCN